MWFSVTMSADKYYTAVFLKVLYADADGAMKKHFHRIESTKLAHYFLADQAPRTYQDPVWRKLRDMCKARCNKAVFHRYKYVGDPKAENFYTTHVVDALDAMSVGKNPDVLQVHEIRAKMYPWSDLCDADTIQKDAKNDLEEVSMDEIPVAV